jgi:hypothetical protein
MRLQIPNEQLAISNQQSAISNQQSAISNQQLWSVSTLGTGARIQHARQRLKAVGIPEDAQHQARPALRTFY